MTTLGWDPKAGLLSADSRTSHSQYSTSDTKNKVIFFDRGTWLPWKKDTDGKITERITAMAGCGTVTTIDMLMHMAIEHGDRMRSQLNAIPDNSYFNSGISATLVVFTEVDVYAVKMVTSAERKTRQFIQITTVGDRYPTFWGSGSGFARTASKLKLELAHCMIMARMLDDGTGGPLNTYLRNEDGFFEYLGPLEDQGQRKDFTVIRAAIDKLDETAFTKKHARLHHSDNVNRAIQNVSKKSKPRARYNWDAEQFEQVKPRNSR